MSAPSLVVHESGDAVVVTSHEKRWDEPGLQRVMTELASLLVDLQPTRLEVDLGAGRVPQ